MFCTTEYLSPLGSITLACDGEFLTGLWFGGEGHVGSVIPRETEQTKPTDLPLLRDAERWLDIYFSGRAPDFLPPLRYGSTPFRKAVCDSMLMIPYGKTVTYGEIAARIAEQRGIGKMSARAVGGAVGHCPISLMIPCHRVVGAGGSLGGYGGRIDLKIKLLELEGVDMRGFFVPRS